MTSNETKMETENTLLPWKLDYPEPYELDIVDAKGKHIAKVWLDDAPVHDYNAMQKARAELIIEAVNTHDALKREVEELKGDLLEVLEMVCKYLPDDDQATDLKRIQAILVKAQKVIS